MLDSPHARRRSFAGLTALALTLGCAKGPPPAAPEASAEPSNAGSAAEATVTPEPAAPEAPSPVAAEPTTAAEPSVAPAGPKDARGKNEIQQVMAANRDKVRACYDKALAANPGIEGDLVVSFVIDPHGEVKQAEVDWSHSDLHVPELDTCAADAVRSIKFPASSRGLESKVNYPFNFHPPRSEPPPKR
jgi:TonB family protein